MMAVMVVRCDGRVYLPVYTVIQQDDGASESKIRERKMRDRDGEKKTDGEMEDAD